MVLRVSRIVVVLAVLAVAWQLSLDVNQALAGDRGRTAPDLFSNYYVAPGPYGGVGARLYVAPLPTPPLVGHTYVTYQPLMPHEFLYQHRRTYFRRHPQGGWTRTVVCWE
jgi:hypothetical protein